MSQPWRTDDRYVDDHYVDDRGVVHRVPEATVRVLREALRPAAGDDRGPLVVDGDWRPAADGVVHLEDGTERAVVRGRRAGLPLGYHVLVDGRAERTLIVAPRRCHRPAGRAWGITAQLYSARSHTSWGIGDLRDLATVRDTARRHGAAFVLVNPLNAAAPVEAQEDCPYSPVTRYFRSPLYLSVADVPGADGTDLSDLALAGAELNRGDRIDRDRVWLVKREALRRIRATRAGEAEFAAWRDRQPPDLRRFATWCAASEVFGPSTTTWPADMHRWTAAGVAPFAEGAAQRIDFHLWLHWLLARQQERFGGGVVHDLPVGVAPDGADAWLWPEEFVPNVTVGAPPDALNTAGQNWGMAPLHPGRLRREGYHPFVRLVRAAMQGAAGIRIDHVLGLFRLWLVPAGAGAADGAYVRYPADDLLAVLALESVRAGVPVIGEDLGTVEDGVCQRLDERGVMSCRVLLLSEESPDRWPAESLASASTHDLPTVRGLWTGTDLADQRAAGIAAEAETVRLRQRLAGFIGIDGADPDPVVDAVHGVIGASPSTWAAVALEDLLGVEHRPNIPATDRPDNWTRPLPVPVDELDGVFAAVAAVLNRPAADRAASPTPTSPTPTSPTPTPPVPAPTTSVS